MASPPTSPPAKRARLDPDDVPPSSSTSSPRPYGRLNGSQGAKMQPPVDSDDEEEQPVAPEEDLSRRDMYLDTVSGPGDLC